MEEWKLIDPNLYPKGKFGQTYSISNIGNVRNNKTGRLLKPRIDKESGYYSVSLVGKDLKVHRLVALHFVKNPNPEKYNLVNHIDGDKGNNVATNLEWTDNRGNILHAVATGLKSAKGERNSHCKLSDQDILHIWNSDLTVKQISEKYKVSLTYAYAIKNKRTRTYLLES